MSFVGCVSCFTRSLVSPSSVNAIQHALIRKPLCAATLVRVEGATGAEERGGQVIADKVLASSNHPLPLFPLRTTVYAFLSPPKNWTPETQHLQQEDCIWNLLSSSPSCQSQSHHEPLLLPHPNSVQDGVGQDGRPLRHQTTCFHQARACDEARRGTSLPSF